jgi:hypothetical protein
MLQNAMKAQIAVGGSHVPASASVLPHRAISQD